MARLADSKTGDSKGSGRKTKFTEVLSIARAAEVDESQSDGQLDKYAPMQTDENSDSQLGEQLDSHIAAIAEVVKHAAEKDIPLPKAKRKTGKRSDPNYTGAYFSIPKDLHRQLDRYVMDLADEGMELDRSQVVSMLIEALTTLSDQVGANAALNSILKLT